MFACPCEQSLLPAVGPRGSPVYRPRPCKQPPDLPIAMGGEQAFLTIGFKASWRSWSSPNTTRTWGLAQKPLSR